ncbi:MAG: methyl-accepting chemotaxis protein, partial [Proteobacteria bacterium]|nr:methyl-accepting chemotaxis protein [Pseudomonadota bacterium]
YLMRSDTIGDKEHRNVRASFRNPEKGSIKNAHMEMAARGEEHTVLGQDYIGRDVIASFGPYEVLGNKWILKSIVLQSEALSAVQQMRIALLIGAILAAFAVSFVALWYARNLALKLTNLAQGLSSGAGTVATTSQAIADVSTRLSEASTEQAASLQETVASVDEISAMVQRNADSAANSSKASDASTAAAQRGKEKVEQMLGSINDISKGNEDIMSSIQKSNQEISEIVHVIKAIADKTKVINDIVFQTKLLSFNASVEAARAGEHGKGFAVVAEEVGNLASMSGKAATEITDMLDKSVLRVTQIVEGTRNMMDTLVKTSKDKVEFGTKTARECAGALDEIMRNVSSVNSMVREITTASQEQSTGIREITKAMSELDQVTQQNTASSNDASHTAKDLQQQAEQLNAYVIELVTLVNGVSQEKSHQPSQSGPSSGALSSVIQLSAFKSKKSEVSSKKVVGLEFEAPKASDSRFEDA